MFPLRDRNRSRQFPLITILLIGLNCFVFLKELVSPDLEVFVQSYALVPVHVNFTNIETFTPFLTSMFLHAGFVHLISNMWFLWVFGDNLEALLGKIKFVLYYLICGLVAGILQYLITVNSEIPMLGASGAIAGVLGGYLFLFPKAKIETLVVTFGGFLTRVELPASFMLFYWFLTQFFSGTASVVAGTVAEGGVAWWAHIGGFACGWAIARGFKKKKPLFYQSDEDQLF